MKKIIYVMGKSASGKDTVFKRIQQEIPELRTVVLYTTRPRREGESDGVEYYFTTVPELKQKEQEGKIIESRTYETVCGPWTYATVDDGQFDSQEAAYLMIGTLESYLKTKEYFGENKIFPVYVEVEDGTRLLRAIQREQKEKSPNYAEVCRRFLADEQDFGEDKLKQCGIKVRYENENLDDCVRQILSDIRQSL